MIRGMATAVLLACVWAAPAPGRERSGSGGRTYALLIGLNYTNDSEMAGSRLRYSANDVEAIREMLLAYWGAAAADIDVLTDDENPDARLVKRRIAALANRAGPGDRIVLFYSGHGATDAEGRWGLVPYRPNREMVWNREITAILGGSAAAEKIFLVDSCYSGSEKSLPPIIKIGNPDFGAKDAGKNGKDEYLDLRVGGWGDLLGDDFGDGSKSGGSGVIRLCSSGAEQKSREYPEGKLGVFTYSLTRGMRRWWEENPSGGLTFGRLFREIYRDVDRLGGHAPKLNEFGGTALVAEKSAPPEAAGGRTYALLIGLNYTNDSEMAKSRLRYSANDAEAIREMLLAYWGAAAADIDVLTDDENPDASLVKHRLAALANRAGPGDRIVLFYSGHGATDAEGRWGLVPYRPNREMVWNREITAILGGSAAAEKIFLVDSCYSGSEKSPPILRLGNPKDAGRNGKDEYLDLRVGGWGDLLGDDFGDGAKSGGSGIIRLCSSGAGQKSREYPEGKLGVFTYSLTRGMRRWWGENPSGGLTFGRLFREIYRDVDRLGGHAPKLNEFGGTALVAEKSAPPEAAGGQGGRGGGKVYALLVGIQYSDGLSTLSRLYGTERDVQAMRDALLRYGGCDEGDIAILADRDRPDRNRIIGELRTLAGKAGPGDRIMFFYSGHGGGENGYGFICPAGFRDNEDGVWYSNDIKPILESSAAASKWMILDTCLSGLKSYGRRRALENLDMFVSDREEGSGRRRGPSFPVNQVVREVIKFSGAYGDEFTYEVGDLDHRMGIFTHFLTRGIAGEADADGDGLLTGGELVSFVQPKVLEETSQPGYELPQKPRLSENGYEVVLSAIRGPAPPGPTPTPVQDGMSPLHRAALDGDVAQAERLLDSGLDVNLRDGSGWTPLHYASDPKMANLFMARGADVNRQSNAGFTPLHAAALLDRNAAAAALLKGGANRNLRDKWGKTPFSRALERNNAELLKILEK